MIERFSGLTVRRLLATGTEDLNMLLKTSHERSELLEVVDALRRQAIDFKGPFRTPRGRLVFWIGDQIVLDSELVGLHQNGELSPAGIATFLRGLMPR
jgi:hypothetical protein